MTPGKLNGLIELLKRYGSQSIAYSTLQSDLNHRIEPGRGYAAYGSHLNHNFMLGNPICSPDEKTDFIDSAISELDDPAFVQIDRETAELLHDRFGYKVTRLGVETVLPIQDYCLEGDTTKSRLRASIRRGHEAADVFELSQAELQERFGIGPAELDAVTAEWVATRKIKRQLRFLARRAVYCDEPFVRKFYSVDAGQNLQGFIFFDPIFEEGEVVGYCPSIMRARPGASMGHVAYILFMAMDVFKAEGKKLLSLGLSPSLPDRSGFRHDPLTFHGLKLLYLYGNNFYNFKGMSCYKGQFKGMTSDSFCATRRAFSAFESLAIARFTGFI